MRRVPFSVMVVPLLLILAGLGIGLGVQAPEHMDVWVTALATAALTYYAFTEARRNQRQDEGREAGMRHRLEAVARLARRSCDATIIANTYSNVIPDWARAIRLDVLQEQFLEIRTLAGQLGGDDSVHATRAFEDFLSAADRVNLLTNVEHAPLVLTEQDVARTQALGFFRAASDALQEIAPRLGDEHPVPAGNTGPAGTRLSPPSGAP